MFEQVRKLLAHQFEVDENTITMDTNIADDLGADSLDVVELVMVHRWMPTASRSRTRRRLS